MFHAKLLSLDPSRIIGLVSVPGLLLTPLPGKYSVLPSKIPFIYTAATYVQIHFRPFSISYLAPENRQMAKDRQRLN